MSDSEFRPDFASPGVTNGEFRNAAGYSTLGYNPNAHRGLCIAKNHTCKAPVALGTKHCVGHLRALGKLEDAQRAAAGEGR